MVKFVAKRLAFLVLVLAAMSVLIFFLTQILPGNAAKQILGQAATPEAVAALERELGLDQSVPQQYLRWIGGAIVGDLGSSLTYGQPVGELVSSALARSVALVVITIFTVSVVGIGLGLLAGLKRDTWVDSLVVGGSSLGICVPEFVIGIILILVFSIWMDLLPTSGYEPISAGLGSWLQHAIMPIMTMSALALAHIVRVTRSSVVDVTQESFVRAAQGRGLGGRILISRYILRNAIIPTTTVIALDVGLLLGETVVVESVFAYPGFGRLTVVAIQQRDLPLLQGCALVLVLVFGMANMVADILISKIDPRQRAGLV